MKSEKITHYISLFAMVMSGVAITPVAFCQTALTRYEYTHPQMGTLFKIVLYTTDQEVAEGAADQAFAKIDTLNAHLSDYLPDSELNRLSATAGTGKRVAVGSDLWTVLWDAQQISRRSGGAFDVTIGPLSKLWRKAFRQQAFPEREKIREAASLVNFRWIKFYPNSQRIKLRKAGMRLDLGGIAKGYALDEAMWVLKRNGISYALIDGGGDLIMSDPPPGKKNWEIAIAQRLSGHVMIGGSRAVATSGDVYRNLEWEGRRYSHIIDPRTGLGVQQSPQVTVIAPTAILADALASAVSVLGIEKGKQLVAQFPACRVYFMKNDRDFNKKDHSN